MDYNDVTIQLEVLEKDIITLLDGEDDMNFISDEIYEIKSHMKFINELNNQNPRNVKLIIQRFERCEVLIKTIKEKLINEEDIVTSAQLLQVAMDHQVEKIGKMIDDIKNIDPPVRRSFWDRFRSK